MKTHALSKDLEAVIEAHKDEKISLGEFIEASGDRSFGILLILLALPSALPIPATGISTPLGIAMFLVALQMIAGRETIWLPEKLMKLKISKAFGTKIIRGLGWGLKFFERFLHPRLGWIQSRSGHVLIGALVALLSLVMQMPIPLTNTLPAMVIFLLALCLTEDDGLMGILGAGLGVIVVALYLAGIVAIVFFGFQSLDHVIEVVREYFS